MTAEHQEPQDPPGSSGVRTPGATRGSGHHVWTAMLLLAWLLGSASSPASASQVEIPGGIASVDRLLNVGHGDPETFLLDLNKVLLRQVDPGNRWERVDERVRLDNYLKDLLDFERRFSRQVTIGVGSKNEKKQTRAFADELGYGLKVKKGQITLVPKDDDRATRRRKLATVLGWDVLALEGLELGETVTFTVGSDPVEMPLEDAEWARLAGGSLTPDGRLEELARDQRLSLLLQARDWMSRETRTALRGAEWRALAAPAHRYAVAFEVRGGEIVVPGGEQARGAWSELVGAPPQRPVEFFTELLDRKKARPAYLWHALSFVPQDKVGLYLGGSGSSRQFVRKLYRRLDNVATENFDHARGGDLGFGTLVRSLPVDPEQGVLALPGGLGLWFTAIKSADAPAEHAAVRRIAERGLKRELDEGEFLQRVLTEEAKVLGVKRPVLSRLIRTANLFPGQEHLLTPEVVVLATRASDTFRLALGVLHDMRLDRAEDVREYLLAVAHLDGLPNTIDRELLILNFQGGAEWLRSMARAGRVNASLLSESLRRWSRLHLRMTNAPEAAAGQLEWIRRLLEALPAASESEWGRGPYERALVHALVGASPEQRFSWQGLEYEGSRGLDRSIAMADRLAQLGIPSADLVLELARGFEALRAACEQESLDEAKAAALQLRRSIRELPEVSERFTGPLKELSQRVFPGGRDRLDDLLREILRVKKASRLSGKRNEVDRAEELLAAELKAFLLAPTYVVAMGDEESLFFDDPHLVRKHLLQKDVGTQIEGDTPWGPPEIVVEDDAALGAHIRGHLGGVASALAEFSMRSGVRSYVLRDQLWFEDAVRTRWHEIDSAATTLVARLVDAGTEVTQMAVSELEAGEAGAAVDFFARRVPLGRLERREPLTRVSISERFILGLALLEEDGFGAFEGELPQGVKTALEAARDRLGDNWRRRLDHVGVASPDVNGTVVPRVGYLPPYELLETERHPRALWQREMLDPKLAVADFLGRHGMPGTVGADLMTLVLRDAAGAANASPRAWEAHLRWVNGLDDDYFSARMRECLGRGLYRAQGF